MKTSLINEISTLADEYDISFNALIVQMCEFALEHLSDKPKDRDS